MKSLSKKKAAWVTVAIVALLIVIQAENELPWNQKLPFILALGFIWFFGLIYWDKLKLPNKTSDSRSRAKRLLLKAARWSFQLAAGLLIMLAIFALVTLHFSELIWIIPAMLISMVVGGVILEMETGGMSGIDALKGTAEVLQVCGGLGLIFGAAATVVWFLVGFLFSTAWWPSWVNWGLLLGGFCFSILSGPLGALAKRWDRSTKLLSMPPGKES